METFLSRLVTFDGVSASTQRQALNALVFLYKHVMDIQLEAARAGQGFCPSISESFGNCSDVRTTEIYTYVMARDIRNLQSPLDTLFTPKAT